MAIAVTSIEAVPLEPSCDVVYRRGGNKDAVFGAFKIVEDAGGWIHTIAIDAISDLATQHFKDPTNSEHHGLGDLSSVVKCLRTGVAAHRVEQKIIQPVRVIARPIGNLALGIVHRLTL